VLGLHALGVGAVFEPAGEAARTDLAAALGLDPGWRPLGLLGAGHLGQPIRFEEATDAAAR